MAYHAYVLMLLLAVYVIYAANSGVMYELKRKHISLAGLLSNALVLTTRTTTTTTTTAATMASTAATPFDVLPSIHPV